MRKLGRGELRQGILGKGDVVGGGCREKGAAMIRTWGRENRDCRMVGRRWTGNQGGGEAAGSASREFNGRCAGGAETGRYKSGLGIWRGRAEGDLRTWRDSVVGRGAIDVMEERRGRILMDQLEAEERNSAVSRFRGMDHERNFGGRGEWNLREMGEGRESGEGRGSRVWPGNRKRGGRGW